MNGHINSNVKPIDQYMYSRLKFKFEFKFSSKPIQHSTDVHRNESGIIVNQTKKRKRRRTKIQNSKLERQ